MGRKSKRQIIDENTKVLGVQFVCGNCKKTVISKVTGWDFHASEGLCEMCGSHGNVGVDLICPECKYSHYDKELNSW